MFKKIDIPKEDSGISLKLTIVELKFTVSQEAGAHALYAIGDVKTLKNLGAIALFSKDKLTSISGEEKKLLILPKRRAQCNCLTSNKGGDDLSIGFD